MKYFLHDTNAFQDEKITELFMSYGYEGVGVFYTILEKLAAQEKPIKTVVLKQQLGIGKKLERVWSFLEQIELISSKNGETFNNNLLKFSEKYQIKKEKNRERVSQWRENQVIPKSVTDYVPVRNTPKVNRSKVKESKVNTADATAPDVFVLFEQFWLIYDKKTDRKKCLEKWLKLNLTDHQSILDHVSDYVKLHPNLNYRKNPLTYLNGECWNDPLLVSTNPAQAPRPVHQTNIR